MTVLLSRTERSDMQTDVRPADQTTSTADPWIQVARYGALTIAAYSLVFQLLAGFSPPMIVIGLLFLGFGVLIRDDRRRLAFASGGIALVLVVAFAAPLFDALTDLESLEAYTLNLFLTLTAIVSFVAGIGAIRRGSGRFIRPMVASAMGLFVAGFAASAVVAAGVVSVPPLPDDARVVAEALAYEPRDLVVASGSGIWMENRDGVRHTFTVEGTDVDLNVPGHSAGRVDVDLDPGTYAVFCDVPGHEAMTLELTITEDSQ
jgi:hypothetical protein